MRSGWTDQSPRRPARRGAVFGLAAVFACVAMLGVACKGPEERAADHVAEGERLLDDPRGVLDVREAAIELRNAVELDPSNPRAHALLGRAMLRLGVVEEAQLYLEEAVALDPGQHDYRVDLARALLFSDPKRAAEIATAVLADAPGHVNALLVGAEADALNDDHGAAVRRVQEAEAQAPDLADVEWTRARVYGTRIRILRLKPGRTVLNPADFQAALRAYDAYIAKGGTELSTVLISKAKLLAGWPGRQDDAMTQYRAAVEAARGDTAAEVNALEALSRFARSRGDRASMLFAVERLTELEPKRIDRWESRIQLARNAGQPTQPIVEALLDQAGDDSRTHVVVARAIEVDRGRADAVAHLRGRIEAGDDTPILLAQIVQIQARNGRPADAARALEELQARHPDDIQTRLLIARRALRANAPREALETIQPIAASTGDNEALRVLARAQEQLGLLEDALATVERQIEDSKQFDAALWAHKAELLRRLGQPEAAFAALRQLDRGDDLTPNQLLLRARIEYDLGRRAAGRSRLLRLVDRPDAPNEAAVELFERERDHPQTLHAARMALAGAHERTPGDTRVFEALIETDLALGEPNVALVRVKNALAQRRLDPRLYEIRARLMLVIGNAKAARTDAERALSLRRGQGDDALAVLMTLANAASSPEAVIETLQQQRARGTLTVHRKVVLGRMLAQQGRASEALALFEEALDEGAQFTMLKADTATLLVALGGDLDRAEQLAREAVAVPGDQVAAADALGRVYMAKGLFDAAMYQFSFAADHARPPNADYLLHLGQALEQMSRPEKARDAYARALEIDPRHAPSQTALGALDGGAGGAAPQTDPS